MLSHTTGQQQIVANKTKRAWWLFRIVDTNVPSTYFCTTVKSKTYGGNTYTFKIIADSFRGIGLSAAKSEVGIQAPNEVTFEMSDPGNALASSDFRGGSVTIYNIISVSSSQDVIGTWKFHTELCERQMRQSLKFTCVDFIQPFLQGDYPNTNLMRDISPSNADPDDNVCIPVPFGTPYIPLRSIYISTSTAPPAQRRFYMLGSSTHTYEIKKVRTPRSLSGKSEWESW